MPVVPKAIPDLSAAARWYAEKAASLKRKPASGPVREIGAGLMDPTFSNSTSKWAGYTTPITDPDPLPLVGMDADSPPGPLYHGSASLSHEAVLAGHPAGGSYFGSPVPAKGEDVRPLLKPTGSWEGDLGPAALYTSTYPERTVAFGPAYLAEVDSPVRDFVAFDRRTGPMSGRQLNSDAANALLEDYRRVAAAPKSLPTLRSLMMALVADDARKAAARHGLGEALEGGNREEVDSTLAFALLDRHARDEPQFYLDSLRERGKLDGSRIDPSAFEQFLGEHAGSGADLFRRRVVEAGAPGLMERYPDTPAGDPEYHFAIYDPERIRHLIKLGLLAPIAAASTSDTSRENAHAD